MQRNISQLDEGYDETRSMSDSDLPYGTDMDAHTQHVLNLVLALPEEQRKLMVESIIRTLPNVDKELIGRYCSNLTHFDPSHYLPAELMLSALSYLEPRDLLTASAISRSWRERALDDELWRNCFAKEGWVLDGKETDQVQASRQSRLARDKRAVTDAMGRRGSRKRKTEEAFSEGEAAPAIMGHVEEQVQRQMGQGSEDSMQGVELGPYGLEARPQSDELARYAQDARRGSGESDSDTSSMTRSSPNQRRADHYRTPADIKFNLIPGLWRTDRADAKLSWSYLYKQRARLERNWEKGAYTMFRLPRPEHAEEGHSECVYTIQHTAKHLVSGSRDRTIRIWDLDTYRLKREPLKGHEASVLCLQFDERPEQDIIVSGGSDAYLIIWKFSTGEVVRKMTNAHDESILNLRFDDRYIVTCSKDKSVKVWSRHALHKDDPLVPSHILPLLENGSFLGYDVRTNIIREHSLLVNFGPPLAGAHQAAVNAVQIHDKTVISASGDRTIKSWNIDTGKMTRTYIGHTKGIACVQFDGRRIVSGSSDNTVRIFDAQTAAEVGCLSGHGNLVRTVQARFGDLETVTDDELLSDARGADEEFLAAVRGGMPLPRSGPGRRVPNPGSRRPKDHRTLGTAVPPGGGGGRWAKIVSGSYDETVVLWKRDREGKWVARLTLSMDGVLKNHGRRQPRVFNLPPPGGWPATVNAGTAAPVVGTNPAAVVNGVGGQGGTGHGGPIITHQPAAPAPASAPAPAAAQTAQTPQQVIAQIHANGGLQQLLTQHQQAQANANALAQQQQQQGQTTGTGAPNPLPTIPGGPPGPNILPGPWVPQHPVLAAIHAGAYNVHPLPNHQPVAAPHLQPNNHNHPPAQANNHAPPAAAAALGPYVPINIPGVPNPLLNLPAPRESNRVFKLQFDARRIVCCSQNKVIVGWDFANGERELERIGGWSLETS
ncbi:hypothetical protein LTR15_005482 [Elasticomyces elasticus]|nr:hypothetical protein LTR15_005482 [Elasticomyces elasticus]